MIEEITERLRKTGACEILTNDGGYCYIHRPGTTENPGGKYVLAPKEGCWEHSYDSFKELWEAESYDFVEVV